MRTPRHRTTADLPDGGNPESMPCALPPERNASVRERCVRLRRTGVSASLLGGMLLIGGMRQVVGQAGNAQPPTRNSDRTIQDARARADTAERAYYTVCMNLLQREWENNRRAKVVELLEETRNSPYRSFEWGYWYRLCHLEQKLITQGATAVAVAPDGRTFATGDDSAEVKLWDTATGHLLWIGKEKPLKGWAGAINAIAFSADGKRLMTGDSESTMVVWDTRTGHSLRTLFGGNSGTCADFSRDGSRVVLNARGTWGAIREMETGKDLLKNSAPQYNAYYCIAYSPDGTRFASCSDDKLAHIVDAATGKELLTLTGHRQPICSVTFSPDGRTLATASPDSTVKLWNAQTGQELRTLVGEPGEVWTVRFSPDGNSLVTGSTDGAVRVWDAQTGRQTRLLKAHSRGVGAIAFFPDGSRLLTASGDGTTKIWDLKAADEAHEQHKPMRGRPEPVNSTIAAIMFNRRFGPRVFSQDRTLVVVTSQDRAEVWDISGGKQIVTLSGHTGPITSISIALDSRLIATASNDSTVKVWEARTGRLLHTLLGHSAVVHSVAFLLDSRRLVSGSEDGTARLWNGLTGKEIRAFKHGTSVDEVGVFLEGSRIVTGAGDHTVRVWNTETGLQTGMMVGGAGFVGWMQLSPDGRHAVSFYPYTVQLWNLTTGKVLRSLPINAGFTHGVAFSPDCLRVAYGNSQGDLGIWDVDTGRDILLLPHSSHGAIDAHFTPDGRELVVESPEGYVRRLLSERDLPDPAP